MRVHAHMTSDDALISAFIQEHIHLDMEPETGRYFKSGFLLVAARFSALKIKNYTDLEILKQEELNMESIQ